MTDIEYQIEYTMTTSRLVGVLILVMQGRIFYKGQGSTVDLSRLASLHS